MTQPQPPIDDDDGTVTDGLAEPTGNGLQPQDPVEQPSQDPDDLPAGTETAAGR